MRHIEKIVIWMVAVLFVVIVIIATDFWLLWLPLEHSSEYPQKIAALFMALTAFVTLLVVYATFNATKQSNLREETRRKDEIRKGNRDREERLLNEIIKWAFDISKCGIDAGIDFFRRYPTEVFDNEEDFIKDNDNFERKEAEHRYWSRLLSEYLHLSKEGGYIKIITTKKNQERSFRQIY